MTALSVPCLAYEATSSPDDSPGSADRRTNEQIARLSAQLHADMGRLGRIDDQASVEPFVERSGVI